MATESSISIVGKTGKSKRSRVCNLLDEEFNETTEKEGRQIVFGVFSDCFSLWNRELISLSYENTLLQFAEVICTKILPGLRSYDSGGDGINDHLWYFQFGDEVVKGKKKGSKWTLKMKSQCFDHYMEQDNTTYKLNEKSKLGDCNLSRNMHCEFMYDMGTSTRVFMKVLAIGFPDKGFTYPYIMSLAPPITEIKRSILAPLTETTKQIFDSGFNMFARFVDPAMKDTLFASVPASRLPISQQLDSLFPNFSKAVMKKNYLNFTMGLSAIVTGDADSTFLVSILDIILLLFTIINSI